MTAVIVRILTGIHQGAEIELTPGTWTFGRSDSCDIILSDSGLKDRHAALTVGDLGEVTVAALDGEVLEVDGKTPAANPLATGALWRLGSVVAAFGPEDADERFWSEVNDELARLTAPQLHAKAAELPQGEPKNEAENEAPAAQAEENEAVAESGEESPEEKEEKSRSAGVILAVAAGCFIVAALFIASLTASPGLRASCAAFLTANLPPGSDESVNALFGESGFFARLGGSGQEDEKTLQALRKALADGGITGVSITRTLSGAALFSGTVKNDRERAQVVALARDLPHPAVLDITVESDLTDSLRSAFNTNDFWPEVSSSKKGSALELTVAGYMRSSVIEENAFSNALERFPVDVQDGKRTIVRRIRHQDEIEGLVLRSLKEAKLTGVGVEYLPGRIRLLATLTPEVRERLEAASSTLKTLAGVPLKIDIVNQAPRPEKVVAQGQAALERTKAAANADSMTPTFRVKGVSGGKLKFVTLTSGEKVFAGGTLPGGFTLISISHNQLVLSKNKKRINYPLRVNK